MGSSGDALIIRNVDLKLMIDNVSCYSISMAAEIVCGSNQNGWEKWNDKDGNKIDIYRSKRIRF